MSKAKPKQKRHNGHYSLSPTPSTFNLLDIIPLTTNQRKTFGAFHNGKNLFLHGVAGSGKTFISIYLSLKEIEKGHYDKIIIYRSTVPSRDMGFMPGNSKEKTRVYEAPYYSIFSKLYNRGDAYDILKRTGAVDFESTAFVRGITIENAIVIVDEMQNMSAQELNSLITRVGDNCKVIFCGDIRQTDLDKRRETTGLCDFYKIIESMSSFELVEFVVDDIVRSKLVKEYILTRMKLEDNGAIKTLHV